MWPTDLSYDRAFSVNHLCIKYIKQSLIFIVYKLKVDFEKEDLIAIYYESFFETFNF